MIQLVGRGPQNLLSSELPRLSPIMNQWPTGILIGVGKLHSGASDSTLDEVAALRSGSVPSSRWECGRV